MSGTQLDVRWEGSLLETLQNPARWDHPTGPPNARSVAVAADRTEGDIIIEGVGEDSGAGNLAFFPRRVTS